MARLRLNPATGKLQITDGSCGSAPSYTDIIIKNYGTVTNTVETNVFQHTFTNNASKLLKITGVAKTYGLWRVYKTSVLAVNLVTQQTTNPMKNDADIVFWASEEYNNTDILIVTFQAFRYETALLGATSETFVRIEGYY